MGRYGVLFIALAIWLAINAARLGQPFKPGHDAYISSQLGAYAYNHVKLGLRITRGANLAALDQQDQPRFYYSYTPLASWLLAIPMGLGVPFHPAVRLVTALSYGLFLGFLWVFAQAVWGRKVAEVAALTAAVLPVSLQYGLACIWEVLSLAPLFGALALFASRRQRDWSWTVLVTLASVAAVMLSWLSWLLIIPGVVREFRRGNRRFATIVGILSIVAPTALQLVALNATGISFGAFLSHCLERMSSAQWEDARTVMSYRSLLRVFMERLSASMGPLPLGLTALVLITALVNALQRRSAPVSGRLWLLLLIIYALPPNLLARNVATYHDFFTILLVPVVAICTGIAFSRAFRRTSLGEESPGYSLIGVGLLLLAMLVTGVWPMREKLRTEPKDRDAQALAGELGRHAALGQVLVMSPGFIADQPRERPPLTLAERDRLPDPTFGCLTGRTALLCYDSQELPGLLAQLKPGQTAVVVQREGELEPLPAGSRRSRVGSYTLAECEAIAPP